MRIEYVFPKWNIYTEDQLHVPKEKCEPVVRVEAIVEALRVCMASPMAYDELGKLIHTLKA